MTAHDLRARLVALAKEPPGVKVGSHRIPIRGIDSFASREDLALAAARMALAAADATIASDSARTNRMRHIGIIRALAAGLDRE